MADESDGLPQDLTDRRVGDYQVLRKLGQGAMGQVYLARQLSLKREVALKILRSDHAANPVALQRFQAEAEAVAQLTHPNIVQVFAVGEHDGLRYIALEYVDGRNLRDYLARKGAPELPLALSILRQVAAALQRAGEVGLVHRDVKPENIMITRKAEVKVADFGLSRYFAGGGVGGAEPLHLTQSGMTLGTRGQWNLMKGTDSCAQRTDLQPRAPVGASASVSLNANGGNGIFANIGSRKLG